MGTMTTEAVELLVAVLRSRGKHNSLHDITRAADALASITRERDEAREENERLRTVIVGRCSVLSATIAALKSWRKRATKAEAERDAMKEGLKPFAARIVDIGVDEDDADRFSNALTPYSQSVSVKVGDIRRAAALVNGEVG